MRPVTGDFMHFPLLMTVPKVPEQPGMNSNFWGERMQSKKKTTKKPPDKWQVKTENYLDGWKKLSQIGTAAGH